MQLCCFLAIYNDGFKYITCIRKRKMILLELPMLDCGVETTRVRSKRALIAPKGEGCGLTKDPISGALTTPCREDLA